MKKSILLTALLALIIIGGCRKNDDTPSPPECRIVKITNGTTVHSINYYPDGKVRTINANNNTVLNCKYSGNTIIRTTLVNGLFDEKSIITLNNDGMVKNVRTETNSGGTQWNNNAYEYSEARVTKRTFTNSSGITPWVRNYVWMDGNIVSVLNPEDGIGTEYQFHTDKLMQVGDFFGTISDLMQYGTINAFYKNKNLLKATVSSSGTFITNYDYVFDASGKIISLNVVSGTSSDTYQYEYQCH